MHGQYQMKSSTRYTIGPLFHFFTSHESFVAYQKLVDGFNLKAPSPIGSAGLFPSHVGSAQTSPAGGSPIRVDCYHCVPDVVHFNYVNLRECFSEAPHRSWNREKWKPGATRSRNGLAAAMQ